MKDLHIVLLNYLTKDDIVRAARSVLADIADCPFKVQVTVADNSDNKDGLKEAVAEIDGVHYVDCGGNIGFGAGNVKGFVSEPARYYFALNRDTVIPENSKTIERIIRFMDENPDIGCIGPKLQYENGELQYSCYRFDLPSILIKPLKQINLDKRYKWVKNRANHLLMTDFDHSRTMPVDWVLGAAMVVRKEVIDEIGWFDPRYFMYLEDADWCRTMWEHGWPVYYVHDIVIMHRYERGSAKVPGIIKALFKNKLARIHLASWCKYLWKWRRNHRYYAKVS